MLWWVARARKQPSKSSRSPFLQGFLLREKYFLPSAADVRCALPHMDILLQMANKIAEVLFKVLNCSMRLPVRPLPFALQVFVPVCSYFLTMRFWFSLMCWTYSLVDFCVLGLPRRGSACHCQPLQSCAPRVRDDDVRMCMQKGSTRVDFAISQFGVAVASIIRVLFGFRCQSLEGSRVPHGNFSYFVNAIAVTLGP